MVLDIALIVFLLVVLTSTCNGSPFLQAVGATARAVWTEVEAGWNSTDGETPEAEEEGEAGG